MKTKWILMLAMLLAFGCAEPDASPKADAPAKAADGKFSVGAVAPEIEGEDLAGTNFKLSDYRGKVVLLDFWGDW
jgi:cytochrome oxidase Cu insertion factor (SCO1/SenC/PrrC family)